MVSFLGFPGLNFNQDKKILDKFIQAFSSAPDTIHKLLKFLTGGGWIGSVEHVGIIDNVRQRGPKLVTQR